jgi:RNA recognition motif-containing protein
MAKKVYVGNLPYEITDEQLKEKFSEIGPVESANIIMDKFSGRSKGFGFVEYTSDDDAQKAIETLSGQDFGGREIVVKEARPMRERPQRDDFGGGGGGSF